MTKPTFIEDPSTLLLNTEPSCFGPTFTEPTHTKIPPPQAPLLLTILHGWISTQINSLGTRMEKLVVVSDTYFYSMEDCMDQCQVGFTSQFEYLQ